MIDGSLIRLRVWREDDLPVLTTLRNDIPLQAQLLARVRGSSTEDVRNWLKSRTGQPDRTLFILADVNTDATLGFLQITDFDPIDRNANLGICLLREACGRGRGTEAITLAGHHLRQNWNLRKLGLRVRADNTGALRCYEKCGFARCGLLKEHVFIEGRWHDIVLMERFLDSAD